MPLVNRAPVILILLYRPERAKRCWQIHERIVREFAHCTVEIPLQRLRPEDGHQLLTHLVGIENWPTSLKDLILNRTDGNPLYVEEVIRTLIDDHILVQTADGQWRISGDLDLDTFVVPDTLQGVLMARLDRLEEPSRQTAQLASVVGRVFPFDILAHIVPENGAKLAPHLVQLQQHETIRETQRAPELVYTFKHALMQEVCYRSLLARIRRLYHRQIASYIELGRSAGHRDAESNVPLIAHHAFVGQDWPRALRYQRLAGQQAQKLFANHEAIDHFEKALQSAENLPPDETAAERQTVHAALGELLITTSQYEPALGHLQEAFSLSGALDDRNAQAAVCNQLARLYELRGEYPPAFEWIEDGLSNLAGQETAIAAELLLRAGFINTRQGRYDHALDQCQEGLRIAEELGELATLARAYNLLGHIARLRGHTAQAIRHFQRAFELQQRAGDIHGQATMHNQIANAYFDLGQWQAAEHHYVLAREIFDQIGDLYLCAVIANNLGGIARNQGRLDEALALYQDGLQTLEQIGGSLWVLGVFHMNLGATYIRRGDPEAAREHLHSSQNYYQQAQARDFLPEMQRHFAEAALLINDLDVAQSHGDQALHLARELEMRGEEGIAMRVLGEIALEQGDLAQAERHLRASLAILEDVGDEYEAARTQLDLAGVCAELEQADESAVLLDRCAEMFQRLDAALDLLTAHTLREKAGRGNSGNSLVE
jgi:tetratricopeptide (TPR) repeat protein